MSISSYPPPAGGGVVDYVFWFSGSLQTNQGVLIPVQAKKQAADVDLLECFLQETANRDILVTFYKNGVSIGTCTIPANTLEGSQAITTAHFAPEDKCTATIDQVGDLVYGTTLTAYARVKT